MTAELFTRRFRHENGVLAKGVSVRVVELGGIETILAGVTNSAGLFSGYLEPGEYEFLIEGLRIPFTIVEGGSSGDPGELLTVVNTHIASTANVHGIPDTATLSLENLDARYVKDNEVSGRDFAGWFNAAL